MLDMMVLAPLMAGSELGGSYSGCGCAGANGCGAGGDCECGTQNGCGSGDKVGIGDKGITALGII